MNSDRGAKMINLINLFKEQKFLSFKGDINSQGVVDFQYKNLNAGSGIVKGVGWGWWWCGQPLQGVWKPY